MGFMAGKRALIVGLASNRSIAWGIAQAFKREGAELAFTYQNDKLKPRVEGMAAELGSKMTYPLDVASDDPPVVFLVSTYDRDDLPEEVATSGAAAYLHKEELTADVLAALWAEHGPTLTA